MGQPVEVEVVGGNEGVFPELTSWEWPIAAYLFLGGLVAGLMIVAGVMGMRRRAEFRRGIRVADMWAIPLLVLGLLLLWADLSNRWNVWRLYTTFELRSAMSWGSWILAVAMVVLAVRLTLHHGSWRRRLPGPIRRLMVSVERIARRHRQVLDMLTAILGVSVGVYTGVLLSSISARPLWDSWLLAPIFLVSGAASGGAFLCLFIKGAEHRRLAPYALSLCGLEIGLLGTYLALLASGSVAAQRSADLLLGGPFTAAFWGLVVVAGIALPLTIELTETRKRLSVRVSRIAPVLTLTGAIALRFVILFAGLESFV